MEKLFKYVGIVALVIIGLIMALVAITSINSVSTKDVFEPYLEEKIPQLATWEMPVYKALLSSEAYQSSDPEQWQLYLTKFATLGQYLEMGKPELKGTKTIAPIGNPNVTYAYYLVPVTFDTGAAHLEISLQASEGKVEITGFRVLSDLLFQ